jgi:hypothetical protein
VARTLGRFIQSLSFAAWVHGMTPVLDVPAATLRRKRGQRFGAVASANRGKAHRKRLRKIAHESRRRNHAA